MKLTITIACLFIMLFTNAQSTLPLLQVSANKRFFQTADGKPFFWLGDTGWLLFTKCSKEETIHYLDTRQQQGFNVVQAMVLHTLIAKNVFGDSALINKNVATPLVTPGNNVNDAAAYDFWDHIDFVIAEAAKRGIYIALVPVWGSNVKDGKMTVEQAIAYAKFLAERFKAHTNIIWLNGGDINGGERTDVWNAIGTALKQYDPAHLVTFHPRGRYISSDWFQNEPWLEFNMFQSGHKNYKQDTSSSEKHHFGEDNWKYVDAAYKLNPVKPVLDGEPSYENIPHGLHDSLEQRWQAADVRRYAYWSVFAGGAGFTYGDNAVMQFFTPGTNGSFGVRENWKETINDKGANEMKYLKQLMLGFDYFNRKPAQEILVDNNGKQYNYILATKGKDFALAYTYTGSNFKVDLSKLGFDPSNAAWYSPSSGETTAFKLNTNNSITTFDPPGEPSNGKDWVLILKK